MASNATVHRPHGIDSKNLLEDFITRPESDGFKAQYDADAEPMLLVDDEPIGDRDDLMRWLARNAH